MGRISPYGYRYVREEHKAWFEIEEEEARIIRMIFEWYAYGDESGGPIGTRTIAHRLSDLKIPTKHEIAGYDKPKKDPGVWGKSSVAKILKNEVYAGIWYYNKSRTVRGNLKSPRPQEEWIAVPVPPIVSRELWEVAQRRAEENTIHSTRNTKRVYLLQGRLKCAVCGSTFRTYTDARNPNVTPKGYYQCGGQKLGDGSIDYVTKPCHRSLRQERWEERIWAHLKIILKEPETILEAVKVRRDEIEEELQSVRTWLASVERNIEAIDQKRARLLDLYLDENSPMPKEMVKAKMSELAEERARFAHEMESLRGRLSQSIVLDDDEEQVRQYCRMASDGIDLFIEEDRRNAIAALNVVGIVQRGLTPEDDVITLTGYIPRLVVRGDDDVIEATTSKYCVPRQPPPLKRA